MIVEQKYSYEELARILGITPGAARALASRHAWRRVRHGDGKVRVVVPNDALAGRRSGAPHRDAPRPHEADPDPTPPPTPEAPIGGRRPDPARAGLPVSKRAPDRTEVPSRPGGETASSPSSRRPRSADAAPRSSAGHADDALVTLQIRVAGLEGQVKALTVRIESERRRADEAIQERNEWRTLAQVLAESIPDGLRWWKRARN